LTVHLEEAVEHLARLEEGAIAGAVGVGLVEHTSPGGVERLCVEAARALVPGGILALETPNPASLPAYLHRLVGDPGHTWAAHHEALRYIVRKAGLEILDVQFLHPADDAPPPGLQPGIVHELLYGPQDYALIASRPGASGGPA
jgi:O-antigen chain-terminating methyltransferase